jgi:excisionase family DNA binding protein
METLISIAEAARQLGGISKQTIHQWLSQGRLRRTKVGRRTMIRPSELQKVICEGGKSPSPKRLSKSMRGVSQPKTLDLNSVNAHKRQKRSGNSQRQSETEPLGNWEARPGYQYAKQVVESLGLPIAGNVEVITEGLEADAEKYDISVAESCDLMLRQSMQDQALGATVDRFYFQDAKWRVRAQQQANMNPLYATLKGKR